MYKILYKISDPDASRFGLSEHSDELGVTCETSDAAIATIKEIKDRPEYFGYHAWLGFAYMWVVDGDGSIIWN